VLLLFDAINARNWDSVSHLYTDTAAFLLPADTGFTYIKQPGGSMLANIFRAGDSLHNMRYSITATQTSGKDVTVTYTAVKGNIRTAYCAVLLVQDKKIIREAVYRLVL